VVRGLFGMDWFRSGDEHPLPVPEPWAAWRRRPSKSRGVRNERPLALGESMVLSTLAPPFFGRPKSRHARSGQLGYGLTSVSASSENKHPQAFTMSGAGGSHAGLDEGRVRAGLGAGTVVSAERRNRRLREAVEDRQDLQVARRIVGQQERDNCARLARE